MRSRHTQKGWVDTFLVVRVLSTIEPTFRLTTLPPAPALPPPPTTSLSSTLKADATDDPIVFNIAVSDIAILLKLWMKRR